MSDILGQVGTFVSNAIAWMQAFLASIVGGTGTLGATQYSFSAQPILIMFIICLPLVGLGVGLLRRIIKTRG